MSNEPGVRTDMVKIIYAICLSELGIEKTAAIFGAVPLQLPGRRPALPETLKILWNCSSRFLPLPYAFRISNLVENELRKICFDPSELVRTQYRKYTGGTALLPGHVLDLIEPILLKLFHLDPAEAAFDYLEKINEFVAPGTRLLILKKTKLQDRLQYHLLVDTLRLPVEPITGEVWHKAHLENMLTCIGISRTPEITVLAERKDPPKTTGELMTFRGFLQSNDLPVPPSLPQDLVDVPCPVMRGNGIARLYAAPYYLYRAAIPGLSNERPEKVTISRFIDWTIRGKRTPFDEIEPRHEQLLAGYADRYHFVFNPGRDLLTLNGSRIARGKNARIMAKIVRAHTLEERTLFYNRDFCTDEFIISSKIDKSFNILIKRAISTFERKAPLLELTRYIGRGELELSVDTALTYEESDPD